MNQLRKDHIKLNPLAMAFAFPLLGMLFVMLISQYEPFGQYSMLYSDMYHQYYPFFVAFRDALRSGESLLYSWRVGLGMDYLGLISYYLASPLNLLSVLVPESWLLEFFSLLMPVKLGLAGLFFAIFLKKIYGAQDISIAVFGTFYALCAWALGYQWNVMWLDTFALLPLVALGTVSLLRDKKFILYTLTLFLSIFSNYYIGFFTCIFVLLLFIVYEICRWQGFRRFFCDLCRIALFSILAIGMTAILTLPAYAALQTTQSSVNQFPKGFRMNIAGDAIIFNHLQTQGIMRGQMNIRGTMMASGTMSSGPAMASGNSNISAALAAVQRAKSVWQGLLNKLTAQDLLGSGGGGGGGGGDKTAVIQDLQEWYNLSRQIANIEQEINNIVAERENIADGGAYLRSLRQQ